MSLDNDIFYVDMRGGYPPSEYSKKPPSKRASSCTLHFLIALDQPVTTISKLIEKWKVKDFQKLIQSDGEYNGVRPLHVAAMKGNYLVVEMLLKAFQETPEQINAQDDRGWTALHHARLTSQKIYQLLLNYGADLTRRSDSDGTAEELDTWLETQCLQTSMSKISVALPGQTERSLAQFSERELFKTFGLKQYRDRRLYPFDLTLLWDRFYTHANETYAQLNAQLKQLFLQGEYPDLLLAPCSLLTGKVPANHAFEVRANQPIAKGAFICEAGGQFIEKAKNFFSLRDAFLNPGSDYVGFGVDPEKVGNVWRWFNSGFPNALVVTASMVKGAQLDFFVSSDPIEKGEPIYWNYGPSPLQLSWGKYILLNKDKMRSWFSQDLEKKQERLEQIREPKAGPTLLTDHLEALDLMGKFSYPFDKPAALMDLIFSKTVSAITCNSLYTSITKPSSGPISFIHTSELLDVLVAFEGMLASIEPQLDQTIYEWLTSQIGTLSVMELIKAIQEIKKNIPQITLTKWPTFKQKLEQDLQCYNWLKSPPLKTLG